MKYFLSICSIMKDEGPYLVEFLEYHLLVGVEHFYLFDNESTDNTKELLRAYIAKGLVTLISWPGRSTELRSIQLAAYDVCLKELARESEFVACIDIDEFLHTNSHRGVQQALRLFSKNTGAVLVHWLLFGSNGHKEKTDQLVHERFTRRAALADHHVKSIIRPKFYRGIGKNVHRFRIANATKRLPCETIKNDSPWQDSAHPEKIPFNFLALKHFHVKSENEYRSRCLRGRCDWPVPKDFETNFPAHDKNEISDPIHPILLLELKQKCQHS